MDTNDAPVEVSESADGEVLSAPRPKAPPIESRFLFVDIAALRAKQLRRGALPRLDDPTVEPPRAHPHKAERIAMEEVRRCLVLYDVPPSPGQAPRE